MTRMEAARIVARHMDIDINHVQTAHINMVLEAYQIGYDDGEAIESDEEE